MKEKKASGHNTRYRKIDVMLIRGIEAIDLDTVKTAVRGGANVNAESWFSRSDGKSALECAASFHEGTLDIAKLLIKKGATITGEGLALASIYGNYDVAELMLKKDTKKIIKRKDILEALELANAGGKKKVVKLLESHLKRPVSLRS